MDELQPVVAPVGVVREPALTAQLREKSLGAPRLGRASALARGREAAGFRCVHEAYSAQSSPRSASRSTASSRAARSRSSSLIQDCISAGVKLRGAGNGRPSSRRLAASDSSNRRRSSALRRRAADSISRKLPMDARLHLELALDNASGGFAQAGPDDDLVERRAQAAALIFLQEPQLEERLHVGVNVLVVPPECAGKRTDLQPLFARNVAHQFQPLFRNRAEQLRDAAKGEARRRLAPGARPPPGTRGGGPRPPGTPHLPF